MMIIIEVDMAPSIAIAFTVASTVCCAVFGWMMVHLHSS